MAGGEVAHTQPSPCASLGASSKRGEGEGEGEGAGELAGASVEYRVVRVAATARGMAWPSSSVRGRVREGLGVGCWLEIITHCDKIF